MKIKLNTEQLNLVKKRLEESKTEESELRKKAYDDICGWDIVAFGDEQSNLENIIECGEIDTD
jgi:hypothetical protein